MLDECNPLWQDVLVSGDQDGIQEQLVILQDELSGLPLVVDVGIVSMMFKETSLLMMSARPNKGLLTFVM